MADRKQRGNEPQPRPIIVKKIVVEGHGGHHGGAWKVAYADFVTAMMAFFLLMWLLGATTEKQRKALADYFTPTLVELKAGSAGATGLFGGDSVVAKENYPTTGGQGRSTITIPRDASGTREEGGKDMKSRSHDRERFDRIKKQIEARIQSKNLRRNIRFTETREGLRIDLIDEADYSMFALGTDKLNPPARALIQEIAQVVSPLPNDIIVRGHTDGLPYAAGRSMNNWMLSSARAEATRRVLAERGVSGSRFSRIEGVADRDPFIADDIYDPRNRRMAIILAWSRSGTFRAGATADEALLTAEQKAAIKERDDPVRRQAQQIQMLDMGRTALPAGAVPINAVKTRKD